MTPEEIKIENAAKKLAGFTPLQEVNEEERYYQSHKCNTYDACLKMAKSDSVKDYWQKGMYSEEDLKNAFIFGRSSEFDHQMGITGNTKYISFEDWFEQNKKKE